MREKLLEQQFKVVTPYGEEIVKEVWESFSGWYWFVTDIEKENPNYGYGYVVGVESEWGGIWRPELFELQKKGKVWKVPRKNWPFISYLKRVE